MRPQRGLTLVEVLVALFILAVLAVLAWRTVAAMTDTQRHLDDSGRRFERLVEAVELIEQDLGVAGEAPGETFFRGDGGAGARYGELRFQRTGSGYRDPVEAGPRRIGYRLRAGRLEKLIYPDAWMVSTEPEARVILNEGLRGLYFRFRDRSGNWHASWPAPTVTGLPRAVEARFLLAEGGEIDRVYVLP